MARVGPPLPVGAPVPPSPTDGPPSRREPDPDAVAQDRTAATDRRRRRVVLALVAVLVVVGPAAWFLRPGGPAPLTTADVDRSVAEGLEKARVEEQSAPPDAAVAYRTIFPSLVTVTLAGPDGPAGDAGGSESGSLETSLGSGVVVNADGSVLTALHVVDGGGPIEVRFADGTRAAGTVTRKDAAKDIAVLAVDRLPEVVVPAVLGGSAQVGDAVFPVGNPLGLQGSLSAGVVSALDRSVRTDDGATLEGLIQFDAAVNPGNSGGPLLNRAGQVVGVVTGLANPSRQSYFVGIGFAVPIDAAGGGAGGPNI